jgi:hypothetical protein
VRLGARFLSLVRLPYRLAAPEFRKNGREGGRRRRQSSVFSRRPSLMGRDVIMTARRNRYVRRRLIRESLYSTIFDH